jgi:hypothetical protein
MINILLFNASNNYKHSWNITSRALFILFENLESCMLIYRYKLSDGFDLPFIWQKFGTSNPDKIDFNKMKGESLLLFHLEVYEKNPEKLRELIDWCLETNKELYIPINNETSEFNSNIESILSDYDVKEYNFRNIEHFPHSEINHKILECMKPLIRDIKIKKLLN